MVVGRILGMAGKALAKKFLGKKLGKKGMSTFIKRKSVLRGPLKTFKKVDKITPHFKKKLGAGAIGGGLAGGHLSKWQKNRKKKD